MREAAAGLDAWLAAREAEVPRLRPGCAKRVVWAGAAGARTGLSVVYVHGFSASLQEIRPVPDRVAAALGANLFFTRLAGHGRDGPAMGEATLEDWRADMAEALEIGGALGDRVLLMGCSTGATLVTLALMEGAQAAGAVFVSPNFGLASPLAERALALPAARFWVPRLLGRERGFAVLSEAHAAYWTCRYPVSALFPMVDALAAVRRGDPGRVGVPALFVYCPEDRIVRPGATVRMAARWGGRARLHPVRCGPTDDPNGHVIAGDIFSPGQTGPVAESMIRWARAELGAV